MLAQRRDEWRRRPDGGLGVSGDYDGIILGTGHNALVLQAYLARSGLRVLSIDRAAEPGGGLTTEPNPELPGFRHNTHSFFHRAVTAMPWYRDLELERHGARYVEPELNVALILPDGRSLQWWTDLDRTAASFAEFSRRDAEALRRWAEDFQPIVERVLIPEAQSPPLPPERRRELLGRSALGRRLLAVAERSPLEFVREEFENDVVRAGLLFFNGLREIDLRLRGFGHAIPALLASRHKAQMCLGGSARLAEALVADIREHGGEVRTGAEPWAILVRDGRAAGVELADGERLAVRAFVASGLNPQQTFLDLLDADVVPAPARAAAADFRYNLIAPLFALNLSLREPPRYRAAEQRPELDRAFMVILGLERLSQFPEIVSAHERGEVPPPIMWGACPTLFDPSQAPPGGHTAFMWEKLPYAVHGDPAAWDAEKNGHGRALLDLWARFAPNLAGGAVLHWFTRSPLDTERRLPNMRRGDLLVGSFAGGQIGYNRPFAGAGCYRTPVPGLYLCGGSTHPGGNVTGLCGYNAAAVLAADLGLRPWWDPPQVERAWQALAE
jgi:phytoene dehydrogenase-like protein